MKLLYSGVSVLLLTVLCLLLSSSPVKSAILSIDLGSEYMKVGVVNVKPDQHPISIATNEISKRKSPSMVAFSNGDMLVGEAASAIFARYPQRVYSQLHHSLSKPFQDVKLFLDSQYLPYDIVEDERGGAAFRIEDGSLFSSEELLALILGYAKSLGEAHAETTIKDAVIAVPPYLDQAQREALHVAAQLGGLNVLSLINQHSAVALQYGADKEFSDKPRHVLFYDMGSTGTYAALVDFSSYVTHKSGEKMVVNRYEVKDVKWNASLGGYQMELRLLDYFVDLFNKEIGGGVDIRNSPKAIAKLKKEIKRTKEILSANREAVLSVEGLYDGRDFKVTITRNKFEELCDDLWDQALVPIHQVLTSSRLSPNELDGVELIGGATRVPKLQSIISNYFGNEKSLDRHLDGDDAVALGSALYAAKLHNVIKMSKEFEIIDPLPMINGNVVVRPMSNHARLEASMRLEKIHLQEEEKRKNVEAKNILESYIYTMKEKLDSTHGPNKLPSKEWLYFQKSLLELEDWLYNAEATTSTYEEIFQALKEVGDEIMSEFNSKASL